MLQCDSDIYRQYHDFFIYYHSLFSSPIIAHLYFQNKAYQLTISISEVDGYCFFFLQNPLNGKACTTLTGYFNANNGLQYVLNDRSLSFFHGNGNQFVLMFVSKLYKLLHLLETITLTRLFFTFFHAHQLLLLQTNTDFFLSFFFYTDRLNFFIKKCRFWKKNWGVRIFAAVL